MVVDGLNIVRELHNVAQIGWDVNVDHTRHEVVVPEEIAQLGMCLADAVRLLGGQVASDEVVLGPLGRPHIHVVCVQLVSADYSIGELRFWVRISGRREVEERRFVGGPVVGALRRRELAQLEPLVALVVGSCLLQCAFCVEPVLRKLVAELGLVGRTVGEQLRCDHDARAEAEQYMRSALFRLHLLFAVAAIHLIELVEHRCAQVAGEAVLCLLISQPLGVDVAERLS